MDFSIVITCHNYARYLGRAIRSALNQNYHSKKYEVIVINDASTDETREVMDSYIGYIRPIHLEENMGLSVARNIGIKRAIGKYVVHVDADDYISENLILVESLFLAQNKDWGAISCDYDIIDDTGDVISMEDGIKNPIACGIMFRKDFLFDAGLYNPEYMAMEEVELRKRFENKYKIGHVNLSLYRYRKHGNNLTSNKELMRFYKKKLKSE